MVCAPPELESRSVRRIRVLVADDDERSLDALVALLDREGFAIDPAHGGREALERLGLEPVGLEPLDLDLAEEAPEAVSFDDEIAVPHPRPYDFMVLDYNMPDLTGIDVLRHVRVRFGCPLPAIMVSGDFSRELQSLWSAVGGFALLPKPVEPADFRLHVRQLVQQFFGGFDPR